MKIKKYVYFFILLIISLAIPLHKVEAKEGKFSYLLEWDKDLVIRGEESYTKNFYLPKNMKASKGKLYLDFEMSPTLIKDISSITVLVNDVEIDSKVVDDFKAVEIPLDKKLIEKGVNTLTVKVFLKSTKDDCEINNDINWIILKKDSYLTFQMKRKKSKYIQDIFDNTYFSNGKNATTSIVIPDELEDINYKQITNLAAQLGHQHRGKEMKPKIKTYTYKELKKLDHEAIVIGTPTQLKNSYKDLFKKEDWENSKKTGLLAVKKVGKNKHFFLITNTEEEIILLNETLSDEQLLSQLDKEPYFLNEKRVIPRKSFNENPALNELGYETKLQKGNVENVFSYYFSIPGNKEIGENNQLSFRYRYSSSMVGEDANVLVSINGEEQFTHEIPADKEEDLLEVTIPDKYRKNTRFDITLKYNLNPRKANCLSRMDDNTWVQVDGDHSVLRLDLQNRKDYNLLTSHGFVEDSQGVLNQEILVDTFENIEMNSIVELARYLGETSQGVKKLSLTQDQKENEQTDSQFIIGLNDSPTIEKINDKLKISISKKGTFLNERLFIQNKSPLAGIQLIHTNDKVVISSDEKEQLNQGIKQFSSVLTDEEVILIQGKKVIFSSDQEEKLKEKAAKSVQISNEILFSILTLLGGLIAIFYIYKRI